MAKKKRKKDDNFVAGDYICDLNEFFGNTIIPEHPNFKIECKYAKAPGEKCKYKGDCDFKEEVMEEN